MPQHKKYSKEPLSIKSDARKADYTIYCDGGCDFNRKTLSWGVIIVDENDNVVEKSGVRFSKLDEYVASAEVIALEEGLAMVPSGSSVAVVTDQHSFLTAYEALIKPHKFNDEAFLSITKTPHGDPQIVYSHMYKLVENNNITEMRYPEGSKVDIELHKRADQLCKKENKAFWQKLCDDREFAFDRGDGYNR